MSIINLQSHLPSTIVPYCGKESHSQFDENANFASLNEAPCLAVAYEKSVPNIQEVQVQERGGFFSLPQEIVLKICDDLEITALAKLGRVCKQAQTVMTDVLYSNARIRDSYLKKGIQLQKIDSILKVFRNGCEGVVSLDFVCSEITLHQFSLVLDRFVNIKEIRLNAMARKNFKKSQDFQGFLKIIINKCSHLVTLHLLNFRKIQRGSLKDLEKLTELRSLHLYNCCFERVAFSRFIENIPQLEELEISLSRSKSVTFRMIEKAHRLKSLTLDQMNINDDDFSKIIQSCQRIEKINISLCSHLGSKGIEKIADLPQVKQLSLFHQSSFRADTLIKVLDSQAQLEKLEISQCFNINDLVCNRIASLSKLSILNLALSKITDTAFDNIIKGCQMLQSLSLSGCRSLTDLGNIGTIKELKYLNLSYNIINGDALQAIASGCTKLETMILSGCTGITATELTKFLKDNAHLKHVDTHGITLS